MMVTRTHFPRTLAALTALALLLILPAGGFVMPAGAQVLFPQGGHVYNQHGQPVNGFRLTLIGGGFSGPQTRYTNASGYYEFGVTPNHAYTIEPFPGQCLSCTPPFYTGDGFAPHYDLDFDIVVGITAYTVSGSIINAPGGNLDLSGVPIYGGNVQRAITDASGHFSFVDFSPGTATPRRSLHTFSPSSQYYNATHEPVVLPPFEVTLADIAGAGVAEFSWDDPGGEGWSYFPLEPHNYIANNPDLVVEADFSDALMSTKIKASKVKLLNVSGSILPSSGVTADTDLDSDNGYLARFEVPITNCMRGELGVAVGIDTQSGGLEWHWLGNILATGTSNLDLAPDGELNLSDLVHFTRTNGSSEGDPNYNPCADYIPSGHIDLSDLIVFTTWYNYNPPRLAVPAPESASSTPDLALVAQDGGTALKLATAANATTAVVRLRSESLGLSWEETGAASGHSLLRPALRRGEYLLILAGCPSDANGILGRLVSADGKQPQCSLLGWELAGKDAVEDQATPAQTQSLVAVPNPFNPKTTLHFALAGASMVDLAVYDISGRLVRMLVGGGRMDAGQHSVDWDGRDESGSPVATGIYFARLKSAEGQSVQKLTILK